VAPTTAEVDGLPPELDVGTPLAGREAELDAMREHWRCAHGGTGRLVLVAGSRGIGKTRLAAELAGEVHRDRGSVLYASGAGAPETLLEALASARATRRPALLVLDDVDLVRDIVRAELDELVDALPALPVLVVATAEDADAGPALRTDETILLAPLDAAGVRAVVRLYADGCDDAEIPFAHLAETSAGVPLRVHRAAVEWARTRVARRLAETANRIAAERPVLRAAEDDLAGSIVELHADRRGTEPWSVDGDEVVCPFKGLASFDVADAGFFFGRERLVAELVARLTGAPLLGIVGPSGSGKSSVMRAGLLAALAAGVLPGSERWALALLRPGEHPMQALEDATADAAPRGRLVIAVDQFEEAFTACRDEIERGAFVDALVASAGDPGRRAVVLVAVRADFYGRCTVYPDLARLLAANHVLVGPMGSNELRRAIELPAHRAGLHVEPELVDALVADVEDEPGALPLLSTALLELWQQRDGRRLRHATYERTAGVRGAVARLAEDAFSQLDRAQQRIARSVLLRLADEGAGGAVVRRRVALTELHGLGDEGLATVLEVLADRRLLTLSATTVEVAHEALLREWPRLRGWLEQDAQGRAAQRHLADAARDWDERGRDPNDLYRGARLAVAMEWRGGHEHELNPTERAFLDTSRAAANRAQRRLRGALAGAVALLAIAVAGGLVAVHQRSTARGQARAAEAQRLGVQALTEPNVDRSLLLAREGVALDDSPATRGNLLAALLRSPGAIGVVRSPTGPPLTAIGLDRDGRTLAMGDSNGNVVFVDPVMRRRIGRPYNAGVSISDVRFSPNGTRVEVVGSDRTGDAFFALLDARTHRAIRTVPSPSVEPEAVVFSPDSRVLAADVIIPPTQREYVMRLDAATGRVLATQLVAHNLAGAPVLTGFIAGGTRLVTSSASTHTTVIRDAETLRPLREFPEGGRPADVSPDGRVAAVALPNGVVRLIDLRTGALRELGNRASATITAMRFTGDSRGLVTADGDQRLTMWDAERGKRIETLDGVGNVQQLVLAPDGWTAYSADDNGGVVGWDLTGKRRLGRGYRIEPPRPAGLAAMAPSSGTFVVPTRDGNVHLIDDRTLRPVGQVRLGSFTPATGGALLIAIATDGRTMAATTGHGEIRFVDLATRQPLGPPRFAHVSPVQALAFSPDGRWLVTSGADSQLYVWNVRQQRTVSGFRVLIGGATSLAVSRDGSKLAATVARPGGGSELDILSMPRLTLLARKPALPGRQTQFSRDGRLLFYRDDTGRVWTLDTRTWRARGQPLGGSSGPGMFALSPDDRTLATTAGDGTTQLWDVPSRRPIGTALPGVAGQPVRATFIERGTELVTLHDDGRGYVWDVQPRSWAHRACAIAGRPLTRTEWREALPDRRYAPVCARD
jgi:WD40 repeat protein